MIKAKEIKFKLFPKEDSDEQKEKHETYIEAGFKLTKQIQQKNGIIKREYAKIEEKGKKKGKTVALYDVNENLFNFPAEIEDELLKQGYRKELPKKKS